MLQWWTVPSRFARADGSHSLKWGPTLLHNGVGGPLVSMTIVSPCVSLSPCSLHGHLPFVIGILPLHNTLNSHPLLWVLRVKYYILSFGLRSLPSLRLTAISPNASVLTWLTDTHTNSTWKVLFLSILQIRKLSLHQAERLSQNHT